MDEIRVDEISHPPSWTVTVDPDGTPRCAHGDRMVEVRPNKWQCPEAAAFFDLLRRRIAVTEPTLRFERATAPEPEQLSIRAFGTWRLRLRDP